MDLLAPFINGFMIGFGLIAAIGMQNTFVLKQGILKDHVLIIVLLCSFLDAILITAGINGMGVILSKNQSLLKIFHWGGIIFLLAYGTRAFISSFKNNALVINNKPVGSNLKEIIMKVLTVSLLNPHVYLDSCVLMGSLAMNFQGVSQKMFNLGAVIASFIWFFLLGFGARLLRKIFTNPKAWQILDFIVGCFMYLIAASLIYK